MPTVSDLLLALNADKSPLQSLIEGFAGGYKGAQDKRLENAKLMMQMDQQRQAFEQQQQDRQRLQQQDAMIREKMGLATEQKTQSDLKTVGTPATPPTPGPRFKMKATTDETGYLKPSFEVVEPKETKFGTKEYFDRTSGVNRIGKVNESTGEIIRSPNDPEAQKPPASLSLGEKEQQYNQKRLTALGDALDPSKQRQGAFGVSKQVFDRAERMQSLASAFPSGNLDSRQIEELAIGLNAMLSGANTGAQEQVRNLVPKSAWGNAMKFKEWFVGDPTGTGQQAFVQRMLGSIDREKSTAADQIKRTQFSRAMRYSDLENSNPDEFYNQLQANGLDPEEYKAWKKGGFKPISAVQKPGEGAGAGGAAPASGGWKYIGKAD